MITIVTRDRERLLGELNMDEKHPAVLLTPLGQAVKDEWFNTAEIQRRKGRKIRLLGSAVMPDHFHGVLFVEERMDIGLGEVVRSFKTACTQARNRLPGIGQPSLAGSAQQAEQRKELARMSHQQRAAYYAAHPEAQPLFADNYDDTVCFRQGQLDNILRYVADNPRRAILKLLNPQLFRLHRRVSVAGFECATLGNLFLLDYPMKSALQCSRSLTQADIDQKKAQCLSEAQRGTLFVSAGISEGEKQICRTLRENGFPLIILLKDGFPKPEDPHYAYFKPHGAYFETCAAGRLLLVEPCTDFFEAQETQDEVERKAAGLPHDTLRYRFLALNALAKKIAGK